MADQDSQGGGERGEQVNVLDPLLVVEVVADLVDLTRHGQGVRVVLDTVSPWSFEWL